MPEQGDRCACWKEAHLYNWSQQDIVNCSSSYNLVLEVPLLQAPARYPSDHKSLRSRMIPCAVSAADGFGCLSGLLAMIGAIQTNDVDVSSFGKHSIINVSGPPGRDPPPGGKPVPGTRKAPQQETGLPKKASIPGTSPPPGAG